MGRGYRVFDQKSTDSTRDQPERVELAKTMLDFEAGDAQDGDEGGPAARGSSGRRGGDGGGGGTEEGRKIGSSLGDDVVVYIKELGNARQWRGVGVGGGVGEWCTSFGSWKRS